MSRTRDEGGWTVTRTLILEPSREMERKMIALGLSRHSVAVEVMGRQRQFDEN